MSFSIKSIFGKCETKSDYCKWKKSQRTTLSWSDIHDIRDDVSEIVTDLNLQVDTATDNHNDNAIFTDDDEKIVNIVAELLGIDADKLKQVTTIGYKLW